MFCAARISFPVAQTICKVKPSHNIIIYNRRDSTILPIASNSFVVHPIVK